MSQRLYVRYVRASHVSAWPTYLAGHNLAHMLIASESALLAWLTRTLDPLCAPPLRVPRLDFFPSHPAFFSAASTSHQSEYLRACRA